MMTTHTCTMTTAMTVSGLILIFGHVSRSIRCLKDSTVPDMYPVNVYYCNDTALPECCTQENQFTCCEKPAKQTLMQQVIIWCVVFGLMITAVVVWLCFRKDSHICEGQPILNRCCATCCRVNLPPEKEEQDSVFHPYTEITTASIQSDEKIAPGKENERSRNVLHP